MVERVFLVPAAWKLPAVAPTTPEQMAFELWVVGQTIPGQTALDLRAAVQVFRVPAAWKLPAVAPTTPG